MPLGRVSSTGPLVLPPPSSPPPGCRLNERASGGRPASMGIQRPPFSQNSLRIRPKLQIDLTLPLPPDMPAGYYRPFLQFVFPDMPAGDPLSQPSISSLYQNRAQGYIVLPTINGRASRSHRVWIGCSYWTHSATDRVGVVAMEDADRFGVAQRILTYIGNVCDPAPECSLGSAADLSPRTVCPDRESRGLQSSWWSSLS